MIKKEIKGVIAPRHDTEKNWIKATNFTPIRGEIIIYEKDENNYKDRIKIGDGQTNVNDLPFVSTDFDDLGGVIQEWVEHYVKHNANTLLYLDRQYNLGHRIELPDVYPVQTDAEFKIVSRNRFKPSDKMTIKGVTLYNTSGQSYLLGEIGAKDWVDIDVLGTAYLPVRGEYSIRIFDESDTPLTPNVTDSDGFTYQAYLKGYTLNDNNEKVYQMYPLMNQTNDVVHIDTRLLGCDYIEVEFQIQNTNSTNSVIDKSFKIQIEYGKLSSEDIKFTPYKDNFTTTNVNIYKKNLVHKEELYDNMVNISDTVYLYGVLPNGTKEELGTVVTDTYGAYTMYGEISNDYDYLRFEVYRGDYVNHPLGYEANFTPPVVKGDKFTFVFRCTSNRMQDDMQGGAIFMLGHIVTPDYEDYFHEVITSDEEGNCDISHINYPYTLVTLSEEDYNEGYNLFIQWDSALTRNWVEDELDKLNFKLEDIKSQSNYETIINAGTFTNIQSLQDYPFEEDKLYNLFIPSSNEFDVDFLDSTYWIATYLVDLADIPDGSQRYLLMTNKYSGKVVQICLADGTITPINTSSGGTTTDIIIDEILSTTSTNPVQNKVIKAELDKKATKTDTLSGYGIIDAYTKAEVDSALENVSVDLSDYIYVGDVIKLEDLQSYIFEEDKVYHFSFSSGLNGLVPSGDYLGEYFDDSYEGELLVLRSIHFNGREYEISLNDLTLYTRVVLEHLYLRDTNNSNSIYSICVTDGKLILEQHDN